MRHPIVTFEMDNGKEIVCELYPEEAPNTVNSFLYLAQLGIYDGHAMERLARDFVADMSYTAFHREEARYLIAYETRDAGFPNHLPAAPGFLVMGGYDNGIAGGEIFFPFVDKENIRWHYPAFGKIISGMEEVMRWNTLPVCPVDFPLDPSVRITAPVDPPVIRKCRVETFGESYPQPVKLKEAVLPANWG